MVMVTSTGTSRGTPQPRVRASAVVDEVERRLPGSAIVTGAVPGGLFLDQDELAARGISDDHVVRSLRAQVATGARTFADAFPSTAVTLGRYC